MKSFLFSLDTTHIKETNHTSDALKGIESIAIMAELYHKDEIPQRVYWDRRYYMSFEDQLEALKGATTLYVGNLSFYTTEMQIHETFSRIGPVKRIIMGLNRETKAPCGFCFVEYYTYENACACLKYISGTMCDGQIIRCELDGGFKQGRQFGRGKSGGQIRDERKQEIAARNAPPPPPPMISARRGREVLYIPPENSDRKRSKFSDASDARPLEERVESGLSSSRSGEKRRRLDGDAVVPPVTETSVEDAGAEARKDETQTDRGAEHEEDDQPAAKYRRRGDQDDADDDEN